MSSCSRCPCHSSLMEFCRLLRIAVSDNIEELLDIVTLERCCELIEYEHSHIVSDGTGDLSKALFRVTQIANRLVEGNVTAILYAAILYFPWLEEVVILDFALGTTFCFLRFIC